MSDRPPRLRESSRLPAVLTTPEAAERLGLTRAQVGRLCRDGWLPCRRAGSVWLIDPDPRLRPWRTVVEVAAALETTPEAVEAAAGDDDTIIYRRVDVKLREKLVLLRFAAVQDIRDRLG